MAEAIVIIGAGQAGATLAETLRAEGHEGPITLVGAEPDAPYQRPPLSKKYLLGEMSADRLALKPPGFWADAGIALLTGTTAVAIDRAARQVRLADGRSLPYHRLALTTGAVPLRLPARLGGGLGGVHVIRNRADVDGLAPAMAAGARLVVVGGGYIGLEAAAVAAMLGLAVTLVEAGPRILGRVAAAPTAAFFRDLHARHGVTLIEGCAVAEFASEAGRLSAVRLADGRALAADLAIVGIGVRPDTTLAESAGLAVEDGIAVDARGQTSDPSIFAAGDAASFPWRGRRIRLESVQNAIDQARATARAMLGATEAYDPVPWFWSDQYDVKLQIAGLNLGHDRVLTRPGSRPGTASTWYFAGERLLAVDAMGDARAYMTAKRWLEAGYSPEPTRIADPGTDLRALG